MSTLIEIFNEILPAIIFFAIAVYVIKTTDPEELDKIK
jgi:hypothetical protein